MNNNLDKFKILSISNPIIPIYKKKSVSNEELIEIKRFQDIENKFWINIGSSTKEFLLSSSLESMYISKIS